MMKVVVLLSKTFFPPHPKAGKETFFACKVCNSADRFIGMGLCPVSKQISCPTIHGVKKIHTCRSNYEYWKKKIDKLKAEGGVLSVRQWSEKPYRSPQETIIDIPAEIVGVQKLRMVFGIDHALITDVGGKMTIIKLERVAENDGLTPEDFKAWFLPKFEKEKTDVLDFAIIHFTKFRY
jgi:hypothetical protein